jgi:hypothetical protein
MSKINPEDSLNASIAALEQKKQEEFQSLKQHLRTTGESMKPGNIIKEALRDVSSSPQLKSLVIKTLLGLAVGYVAKRLIAKGQNKPKHQFLGNALQYGATFLAANQSALLKTAGTAVATGLIAAIKNRRAKKLHTNGVEHPTS